VPVTVPRLVALVHEHYSMIPVVYFDNASYSQGLSGKFFEIWAVFRQVNNAKRNHY
jgi:hypothetical protein